MASDVSICSSQPTCLSSTDLYLGCIQSLLLLHRQLAGVQQQQQQQASQHQQQMPTRRPISLNSPLPSTSAGASAGPSSVAELVEEARAPAQQRPEDPAVPEAPVPKRKSRFKEGSAAKRSKTAATHEPPATLLRDLGGIDKCVESILELVALPLCHPEIYLHTGVRPPRGVLLVGPPGCGKTMLAGAIAGVRALPNILLPPHGADHPRAGAQTPFHLHFRALDSLRHVRRIRKSAARDV